MEFSLKSFRCLAQAAPLALLLSACAVGSDYVKSNVETPPAFKEQVGWKIAQPADLQIPEKWWEMYNDPVLNKLEEQVTISNQTVIQAEAQYRQARALVQAASAAYYPTVAANVSSTRTSGTSTTKDTSSAVTGPSTTDLLTANVSWEPDIWGRVRRTIEANTSSAQASAAELQAMRLSTQAQLAQDYFQLRDQDADRQLYDKTVIDYKKSLELTQHQFDFGMVLRANVVLAETLLKQTEAQAIDFDVARAQMEHAIALLVGKPASTFSIAQVDKFDTQIPVLPLGLPSALLERRPDIANAERLVAAANAQIGVSKSAYFPDLTLAATGGYQSSGLANWISLPNRIWSLGPSLAETLFDGGARKAVTDQAIAAYDASVANYRQTVLAGFREVEDNIAALRILEQEAKKQEEAVKLSRRSVELMIKQYEAGLITYLDVITVETTALSNERVYVDLLNKRLSANVLLIKALGGGWSASQLPTANAVEKPNNKS
ncbi:efflux transporter outer membrane subunit [Solimicrobium silvestre]|uniref:Efflux transporter, outer membrane factor (OMF) lipoprotein, NodT family n=1 Tax=Solimicrobium silvestre TaxID=2099400 RepID=A0A2S9GUM1_9BURK|nr:efflux transporter outer membrane subunit [Solimicrobium silvestre]PRC91432.1 Efflux transporter, outer membrane factor (OMF) lipoprotein, NodT family [Solimicrobium silvestre]